MEVIVRFSVLFGDKRGVCGIAPSTFAKANLFKALVGSVAPGRRGLYGKRRVLGVWVVCEQWGPRFLGRWLRALQLRNIGRGCRHCVRVCPP